jgi:uncharacterized protein YqjF (DUF2071 family)
MANYEVDPKLLRALVPAGTDLDLWSGRCLVSVVGFQFLETRVLGLALPLHRDFEEVNLRFYVRRTVGEEVRRGVVFVKEIVPRRAIAWIANAVYSEKYIALPMAHDVTVGDRRRLSYGWRHHGAWCRLAVTQEGSPALPADDSEEAFITEHYWGYTAQRDGSTLEYQVEHPRWNVWTGSDPELVCDTAALYGSGFGSFLSLPPSSCFVAAGSAVIVRRGVRVQ